jgi:hypothetical protein
MGCQAYRVAQHNRGEGLRPSDVQKWIDVSDKTGTSAGNPSSEPPPPPSSPEPAPATPPADQYGIWMTTEFIRKGEPFGLEFRTLQQDPGRGQGDSNRTGSGE